MPFTGCNSLCSLSCLRFCPHAPELSLYTHPYTLIPIFIGFLFDFQDTKVLLMQQYWPFTVVLWFLCSRKFSCCVPHILSFSNFPSPVFWDFSLRCPPEGCCWWKSIPPSLFCSCLCSHLSFCGFSFNFKTDELLLVVALPHRAQLVLPYWSEAGRAAPILPPQNSTLE